MKRALLSCTLTLLLLAGSLAFPPVASPSTVFIVDSFFDDADAHDVTKGDCLCADTYGDCTLRAAIEEANICPGPDTITFDTGMVIFVSQDVGALPSLDETVKIDASSVWDWNDDVPGVTIDGRGAGIWGLGPAADSCEIYGLYMTNFDGTAIYVTSATNKIGGPIPNQRNVLSGNDTAITLSGVSAHSNVIGNNYIGLTPAGDAQNPNDTGLLLTSGAHDNTIGGSDVSSVNFISGNTGIGVMVEKPGTDGNRLDGNVIGLASDFATDLGNGRHGILLKDGIDDTVIGSQGGRGNLIGYNGRNGINVDQVGSGTQISYNIIGGNASHGVYIGSSTGCVVSNNLINVNTLSGVSIHGASAAGNLIWPNSISGNGQKGIYLGNGANMDIVAPVVSGANGVGASGTACASCLVALYSDNDDQGQFYHGMTTADGAGNWTYDGILAGPHVTATAIDLSGNTSEFSTPFDIGTQVKAFLPQILRNR